jgi:hypothetical protein
MSLASDFMKLFTGLMRAHGSYIVMGKPDNKGKMTGKAVTLNAEVNETLWEGHLSGKQGIGIVPIDDNSEVNWSAIDVDDYKLDHKVLGDKISALHLPLVMCRSKSGGAHLYVFYSEPVSARLSRARCMEWATALGHAGVEIFPKQIRLANKNDVGNWINMPYFNASETERFAIYKNKKLSAAKFIQYAKSIALDRAGLEGFVTEIGDGEFADGPPCLQALASSGFPQGTRNMGLFNMGVYARNKFGDLWQEKLEDYNRDCLSPPLANGEVAQALKSLSRKTYFYTCDKQPIVQCCNKELCKKREFGIGHGCGDDIPVTIGTLTRINSEVPTFYIDVEGIRMEVTPEELLQQDKFRTKCIEKISKLPTRMKQPDWEAIVRDRLENQEVVEAPRDAGPTGQFFLHLEMFLTNRHKAKTVDELLLGKPFPDPEDGRTYFRSADLMKYLDQMHFREFTTKKIWSSIRDMDGQHAQKQLKGRCVQCWSIPSPSEQTEEFEAGKF